MAQDERLGWQRCAASADWGGAAAAGVLQEGRRQEAGAKGGASRLPLTFCLLRFRRLYLGKFPQTPLQLLPTPTPYSLLPKPYPLVRCRRRRGEASSGRLLTPASSPPVRCPRQRCALLPKQNNRARGGRLRGGGNPTIADMCLSVRTRSFGSIFGKLVMQLTQPDTRCRICLHERQGVSRYVR